MILRAFFKEKQTLLNELRRQLWK